MSEYDLAAEGDLFKALEPIIKEPIMDMDPMTAAISMISSIEPPFSEILEIEVPLLNIDENTIQENKLLPDVQLARSVSLGSLSSMDWMRGDAMKPDFIDIPVIDFNTDYGMQRSFSEGDIMFEIV
ncbi:hypothetical protein JHK84_032152 [Glycine max]|nr:hypothetical protein JHK84_032152 [Glycine max]